MRLFKRNIVDSPLRDKAASGIATIILKCQQWFAFRLDRYTKKWQVKQQWIFLYFVCGVFGSLSILAVFLPFSEKAFKPKSISFPRNIPSQPLQITEEEFQKVQQYKITHPELIKEHPGLYDSLKMVEQAYYSQKK
ncbi:MAG: hypothetical protein ABI091_21025 [Ferruginibacter sp.]